MHRYINPILLGTLVGLGGCQKSETPEVETPAIQTCEKVKKILLQRVPDFRDIAESNYRKGRIQLSKTGEVTFEIQEDIGGFRSYRGKGLSNDSKQYIAETLETEKGCIFHKGKSILIE